MTFPAMSIERAHGLLTQPGSMFELGEAEIRGVRTRIWKNAPPTLRAVFDLAAAFDIASAAACGRGCAQLLRPTMTPPPNATARISKIAASGQRPMNALRMAHLDKPPGVREETRRGTENRTHLVITIVPCLKMSGAGKPAGSVGSQCSLMGSNHQPSVP